MINLKLAEYNRDGKFQGFLELEKPRQIDGENIIGLFCSRESFGFVLANDAIVVANQEKKIAEVFIKDKKDPLKRCNGIFNGLTYGEGRFTLIEDYEDTRTVHYNNEEITLYNIGSGYVSFSHGKYYKN
jgi:hypothetical protein